MKIAYVMLSLAGMLLLTSCSWLKPAPPVPVAVECPTTPLPPQDVVKSVSARQPIMPRFNNSAQTLLDSYKKLGDTLTKGIAPISTPPR